MLERHVKTCTYLVYAYNLLVLGLNRGSPSEEKSKYEFTYGTLNRGSPSVVRRLLLFFAHSTTHSASLFPLLHILLQFILLPILQLNLPPFYCPFYNPFYGSFYSSFYCHSTAILQFILLPFYCCVCLWCV